MKLLWIPHFLLLKEFLICLIKIYSARHNNHQTPVNLDKFIEFIKTKTELSLEDFGVNSQNPSEDKVVMELTQRGLFTSSSKEILSAEIFDLFSAWLLDNANPNRQSFARYIKKNVRLFGGQRLGDKAIGRLIDQFIETYKHLDVGQYLQSNNPGPRNPNHQKWVSMIRIMSISPTIRVFSLKWKNIHGGGDWRV